MSSAPNPTYVPDPPSRFRWVPPLGLGVAVGGLIGCMATFALLWFAEQERQKKGFVAEQFNIDRVLGALPPGTGNYSASHEINHLGHARGGRPDSGSAVQCRFLIQGPRPKTVDTNAFCTQLETQIITEMSRHGASANNGSGKTSIRNPSVSGNLELHKRDYNYRTPDGHRGHIELKLEFHQDSILGLLILTEGR